VSATADRASIDSTTASTVACGKTNHHVENDPSTSSLDKGASDNLADDITNFVRSFSPTVPLDDVTFAEVAVQIEIASETGPWWPEIGSLVASQR
jgi:hypothetical protein